MSEITGPKLSRREIADILKRNCELYREESTFPTYLVELAMYLIEFQYDPDKCDDRPGTSDEESERIVASIRTMTRTKSGTSLCPVCGTHYKKGAPCPGCGIRMR